MRKRYKNKRDSIAILVGSLLGIAIPAGAWLAYHYAALKFHGVGLAEYAFSGSRIEQNKRLKEIAELLEEEKRSD